MKGIIKNDGQPAFIFKRRFSSGHTVELSDLWRMYGKKVEAALGKKSVTEKEFVGWLRNNDYMLEQFSYIPAETSDSKPLESVEAPSKKEVSQLKVEQAVVETSWEKATPRDIGRMTYKDIASLKLSDNPQRVLGYISSISKLRRAYGMVRTMPRKRRLEKMLRERISELESM